MAWRTARALYKCLACLFIGVVCFVLFYYGNSEGIYCFVSIILFSYVYLWIYWFACLVLLFSPLVSAAGFYDQSILRLICPVKKLKQTLNQVPQQEVIIHQKMDKIISEQDIDRQQGKIDQ